MENLESILNSDLVDVCLIDRLAAAAAAAAAAGAGVAAGGGHYADDLFVFVGVAADVVDYNENSLVFLALHEAVHLTQLSRILQAQRRNKHGMQTKTLHDLLRCNPRRRFGC